ncbi:hypothetical protein ANAPC3_00968 [Anaplasma phagocytophilum]|nr:hypothetical protein ANAPC4_00483 [Anaplasma phagocytophilum]SBO32281.1 hypothetical protein ANAPC2_00973 [Anaplasma phagocytophilum]SBO32722.1 hypothetical protein ANAPC3_00968 [Anaplasma phagocytophilum]
MVFSSWVSFIRSPATALALSFCSDFTSSLAVLTPSFSSDVGQFLLSFCRALVIKSLNVSSAFTVVTLAPPLPPQSAVSALSSFERSVFSAYVP